jgi:hypothetical protein
MMVHNCSPVEVTLERDELIGHLENISHCEVHEINADYVQEVTSLQKEARDKDPSIPHKSVDPPTSAKVQFIKDNVKCGQDVDSATKEQYTQLLLKHLGIVNQHKFDLGHTNTVTQSIQLKTKEPVYISSSRSPALTGLKWKGMWVSG